MKEKYHLDDCHHLPVKRWWKTMNTINKNAQQVQIPQERPMQPQPPANPSAAVETSSSTMCSFLSSEETATADFYFRFSAHLQKMDLVFPPLPTPPPRTSIRKHFLWARRAAARPRINQDALVSSSLLPSPRALNSAAAAVAARPQWTTNIIRSPSCTQWMTGRCKSHVTVSGGRASCPWAVFRSSLEFWARDAVEFGQEVVNTTGDPLRWRGADLV